MYEESELSYFKGGLAVGIGLGLLSGVASTIWYHRKKVLSADQVLENIKSSFLKEGAIEVLGSLLKRNLLGNSPFGRVLIGEVFLE